MDLLRLAQNQRKRLLDEIAELEWFLRVADSLLMQRYSIYANAPRENALLFGPILRIDKSDFKHLITRAHRRKHQMDHGR